MKGIVLAGGTGSRLFPITKGVSKQLLPVYDKPMIYYPISTLMLAGIKDILIITTPHDQDAFRQLLGNGEKFGINLQYATQEKPNGIGQAFIIGEDFIGKDKVCLILGDNIFFGQSFTPMLEKASQVDEGACVFAYRVRDPERFGVVEFNNDYEVLSIEEKPDAPKSDWAITGLYFYDNDVIQIAKDTPPSNRGEVEITSINEAYLKLEKLKAQPFGRGFTWLDAGTYDTLLEASQLVETIQKRQGYRIACLEEIGFRNRWLSPTDIKKFSDPSSPYDQYVLSLLEKKSF